MSELFEINELPEGEFPMILNIIDQYQQKDPCLTDKLKCDKYKGGYFCGVRNTNFNLIPCKEYLLFHQKSKYT